MQGVLALGCYTSRVRRRSRVAVGGVSAVGVGGWCWGVAIIVVVVMMMANWRCCELRGCSWLAQESGRVVVPHANCAAEGEQARRGSGWPGLR